MKEYVGTKKIEAKEMTRGEYNHYRGWTIPENENPADEGYLVRYSDGYESWSPKKQFEEAYRECGETTTLPETALLMQSADYKERFMAEYKQLDIRIGKLATMLSGYAAGTLNFKPSCPYDLLEAQLNAMQIYRYALIKRAEIEGIEL